MAPADLALPRGERDCFTIEEGARCFDESLEMARLAGALRKQAAEHQARALHPGSEGMVESYNYWIESGADLLETAGEWEWYAELCAAMANTLWRDCG